MSGKLGSAKFTGKQMGTGTMTGRGVPKAPQAQDLAGDAGGKRTVSTPKNNCNSLRWVCLCAD